LWEKFAEQEAKVQDWQAKNSSLKRKLTDLMQEDTVRARGVTRRRRWEVERIRLEKDSRTWNSELMEHCRAALRYIEIIQISSRAT
jgi:hypothetical protein